MNYGMDYSAKQSSSITWNTLRRPLPKWLVSCIRIAAFIVLDFLFFVLAAGLWR